MSKRERLIEKYRDINVDHDWWVCVEADFEEDMKAKGIDVTRIYFTGFCSQGDGACFVGSLQDPKTYLDLHHADQFPMIRKLLDHGGSVYAGCSHSGRYYHENCTNFSFSIDTLGDVVDCPTEFHEQIVEAWDAKLNDEVQEFETALTDQWRVYMRELYGNLEAEYDYLTSDEAVWETIEANELDKDGDDGE